MRVSNYLSVEMLISLCITLFLGMLPLLGYSTFELDEFYMNLRKQVTCSICLDICNEPKIISCLHTFCFKCIERHARLSQCEGKFKCPECQVPIDFPKENCFNWFPHSFFHQSLINILQVADHKGALLSNKVLIEQLNDGKLEINSYCITLFVGMFPLPGSSIFDLEKEPEELHMKLQRMEGE